MKQIQKSSEVLTKKVIINRISDIPGGVSLDLSTLVAGNYVLEATPLAAPVDGKRKVCKQVKILANSTTTVFRVESGMHNFKTGDIVFQQESGQARACTVAVAAGTQDGITYDTITVGTALESATEGTFLYESSVSAGEGATNGALENDADVIIKEAFQVPSDAQVIWMSDAYLRADILENYVGTLYLADLDVKLVKY